MLTGRRNGPGLFRLAVHGGAIAGLGALILAGVPWWPLLLLPQGILIVFLFTLLHECVHETAFATPWLNRAVAAIAGFLVMVPATWFRYFHFAHHRHTHDPDNDPELMSPKPETLWQYVEISVGHPAVDRHGARRSCSTARGRRTSPMFRRRDAGRSTTRRG